MANPEITAQTPPADTAEGDAPRKERKSLGPLAMVWKDAAAYPGRVAAAGAALVITSATTAAVPWGFRQVVDKGFARGSDPATINEWFLTLLGMVVILGIGTAVRFYNVSWLGERVVADIRLAVQRNLLRQPPSFFEDNSPKEISSRMTADTGLIEQVVGTTVSVALRNLITAITSGQGKALGVANAVLFRAYNLRGGPPMPPPDAA